MNIKNCCPCFSRGSSLKMQELQKVDQAVVVRDIEDAEDEAIFDKYLENVDSIDSQREPKARTVTWAKELVEVREIPTREDLKASGAFDRMFHKKK